MFRKCLRAVMVLSVFATASLLPGQFKRADPADADEVDPTDAQHAVARLAFLSGEVNVQRGESAGTVAAAVNAPLVANDHLETGAQSSAEIELDSATVLRVAENSDLGFGALDASGFQAQLGSGTVIYRVVQPGQLSGELDTPNIAIRPLGACDLRVSVLPDGTTLVQVRSGEAELLGPAGDERLTAGRGYLVRGNPTEPEFQEVALAPSDGFDGWSAARDASLAQSQSAQYLPPGVSGAADLDANGSWVPSEYGQAWTPSGVAADWSPYSTGSWTYENYYGWTWIDSSSWGWAPYHYGRWFRNANYGWCWWPGSRVGPRPWRPAVVGFYGWGGGYRGLGWVPLAPHERFHSWWGSNSGRPFGYGGGNYTPSYRNASYRGAVTFASYRGFAGPGQRFSHLSHEQLAGAAPLGGRIPVVPARSSYSFSQREAYSNVRSSGFSNGFTASRFRSTVSSSSVTRYGGSPNWNRIGAARTAPAIRPNYTPAARPSRPADSGWGHFGDPGRNSPRQNSHDRQGFRANPGTNAENGWHQFGRPAPPSGSGSRDWNRGGGGARPNFNAPQRSAPSAPRNNGGGASRGNNSGGGRGRR